MFLAGLTQARSQIDQTRRHDVALRIDHATGTKTRRRLADGHDAACGNRHIGSLVQAAGGVDDAAVLNQDFHGCSPPGRPKESRAPSGGNEYTK